MRKFVIEVQNNLKQRENAMRFYQLGIYRVVHSRCAVMLICRDSFTRKILKGN